MKSLNIYIDTSLKGPRRGNGTCAYIISCEVCAGKVADTGGFVWREDATENSLALTGLLEALRRLNTACAISIYLECPYVAAALRNGWYQEWRYNGWMTVKGKPVTDAGLWEEIESLLCLNAYVVLLREPHPYREWMRRELTMRKNKPPMGGEGKGR